MTCKDNLWSEYYSVLHQPPCGASSSWMARNSKSRYHLRCQFSQKKKIPSPFEYINYNIRLWKRLFDIQYNTMHCKVILLRSSYRVTVKTRAISRVRFVLPPQGGGLFPFVTPNETEYDECKADQGTNDGTGDRPL